MCTIRKFGLVVLLLAPLPALCGQVVHTSQADFDGVESLTDTFNISTTGDELSLTNVDESTPDYYRGPATFDSDSYWIDLNKDLSASPLFFSDAHPCLDKDDLSAFYEDDTHYLVGGRAYRVGPENGPGNPEATIPSGLSLMTTDWTANSSNRAHVLSFLTSGTHADTPGAEASYTVEIDYIVGAPDIFVITVPYDSNAVQTAGDVLASDGAPGVCSLFSEDNWCIYETGDAVGSAGISCDSDNDDEGHLWEVVVALGDAEIEDITISYNVFLPGLAPGLGGPIAVTLEVDQQTYHNLFDFEGAFVTLTDVIDAGAPALWWELDYTQTAEAGEVRVEFDCDETNGGYQSVNWNNGGLWPYRFSNGNPASAENQSFAIVSEIDQDDDTPLAPPDDNPGDHCRGRYAAYSVFMRAEFAAANAPTMQDISLRFAIDGDQDGWGVGTDLPPHQDGQEDECDADPAITGAAPLWYADCDGDGAFGDFAGIPACTAGEALANDQFCDGMTPFDVTLVPPEQADCDDFDPAATLPLEWYPDCDADGYYFVPVTPLIACSEAEANTVNICEEYDGAPLGGWSNLPGTDCNDEDPDEFPGQTWYADCDGDGTLGSDNGIVACLMSEALNDMAYCAGNDNGGLPFDVSSTPPVEPDCDDSDPTGSMFEDWYPDCDDDDVHASVGPNACGITGANAAFDCASGFDPPGTGPDQWVTVQGTDCDDEDPDAADPSKPWWADCDGDAAFQATPGIFQCTMFDALADDQECAGNDNGNFPYDVDDMEPIDPDCDDFNADAQVLDCSGICGGSDTSCMPFLMNGFELSAILNPDCGIGWLNQSP